MSEGGDGMAELLIEVTYRATRPVTLPDDVEEDDARATVAAGERPEWLEGALGDPAGAEVVTWTVGG